MEEQSNFTLLVMSLNFSIFHVTTFKITTTLCHQAKPRNLQTRHAKKNFYKKKFPRSFISPTTILVCIQTWKHRSPNNDGRFTYEFSSNKKSSWGWTKRPIEMSWNNSIEIIIETWIFLFYFKEIVLDDLKPLTILPRTTFVKF